MGRGAAERGRGEAVMTARYAGQVERHDALRDDALRRSAIVARWRLATFLPAVGLMLWAFTRDPHPLAAPVSLVLFVVFAILVVRHARIEEQAAWHEAIVAVNRRALARIARRWDALPPGDPPSGVDIAEHPYAQDLDLFGRVSLFRWLGPAATAAGSARLAAWLLAPAEPDEIRARQAAAAELAPLEDWREQVAAHGVLAGGGDEPGAQRFLAWAEGPGALGRREPWFHALVVALTATLWITIAMHATGAVDEAYWLYPLLVNITLSFGMTKTILSSFERAGAGQRTLGRYAALLEDATGPRFASRWLQDVQARLRAEGTLAPACMRRLARILGFAELRSGAALLHFPIQALTLWDFHVLFALERWRRHVGGRVRGWFDALADLDALSCLAGVRHDNPAWAAPVLADAPLYRASDLGHPLLPDDRRVGNDIQIGPPGSLVLVTGSNMSGKSTLLRAVGLNAVLAQAGAVACASRLELPPLDLQSSIRVQDSLELGLSYFMAALARLKGVVDAAEHPRGNRVLLYLLDEILQGTNSAERGIAVQAVARHLLAAGAIGIMTTHDLNLAAEEPLKSSARLVHFTEIVDEHGVMRFDYRLRDGLATSRNALRLMQLIGIST
jgi:hypothetical protein